MDNFKKIYRKCCWRWTRYNLFSLRITIRFTIGPTSRKETRHLVYFYFSFSPFNFKVEKITQFNTIITKIIHSLFHLMHKNDLLKTWNLRLSTPKLAKATFMNKNHHQCVCMSVYITLTALCHSVIFPQFFFHSI